MGLDGQRTRDNGLIEDRWGVEARVELMRSPGNAGIGTMKGRVDFVAAGVGSAIETILRNSPHPPRDSSDATAIQP